MARSGTRPDAVLAVALAWVEAHCVVPDRFLRGARFRLYDQQLAYLSNFYLVRGDATWDPADPVLGPAFRFHRGLWVGPQKVGKGPLEAAHTCLEGVGPALFAGWAGRDDGYVCAQHGCRCGWQWAYRPGEPMGTSWATPLVQITAVSEEQTENVYDALRPMIELGPLGDVIRRTGEEFIRLPGGGRIDTVTSSAQSRLGQRVTFVPQDEVGLWTARNKMSVVADTQYRGLAGMGGRASLSTNAWDPSQHSVAQQQWESTAPGVYKQFVRAPAGLSYRNKAERRKIHRHVYGDALRERGGHIDLDSVETMAVELVERDPAQAERFFGNRVVHGSGAFLPEGLWAARIGEGSPELRISLGFDGSSSNDWTALRAETVDGFRFTPQFWVGGEPRPAVWDPSTSIDGRIPRAEVRMAVQQVFARFEVVRMYCDPRDWQSEIDEWAVLFGDDRVVQWPTNQLGRMHAALNRYLTDLVEGTTTHQADAVAETQAGNARMVGKPGDRYLLAKPSEHQKIDVLMADVLAHEAAADARTAGWAQQTSRVVVFR